MPDHCHCHTHSQVEARMKNIVAEMEAATKKYQQVWCVQLGCVHVHTA